MIAWLLIGSMLLNGFLFYAWIHDTRIWEGIAARYEQSYHDTLDSYLDQPRGTTMKRLADNWPEGSPFKVEDERKYLERYGGEQ